MTELWNTGGEFMDCEPVLDAQASSRLLVQRVKHQAMSEVCSLLLWLRFGPRLNPGLTVFAQRVIDF
jgi:hypothetical protein